LSAIIPLSIVFLNKLLITIRRVSDNIQLYCDYKLKLLGLVTVSAAAAAAAVAVAVAVVSFRTGLCPGWKKQGAAGSKA
jgi:hypothetical protein